MPEILWDPEAWLRSYQAGINPARVAQKIEGKIEQMHDRGLSAQATLAFLQELVVKLCAKRGVIRCQIIFYCAYVEEIFFRAAAYEWDVDRRREHEIIRAKWERRGLDPALLDEIDKIVSVGVGRRYVPPP